MTILREDVSSLDLSDVITGETIPLTKPGDVLRHDFMEPLGVSAYAVAKATGLHANRITAILNGKRAITAETAIRLAAYFGTSPEMWMNLQSKYDLALARERMVA